MISAMAMILGALAWASARECPLRTNESDGSSGGREEWQLDRLPVPSRRSST